MATAEHRAGQPWSCRAEIRFISRCEHPNQSPRGSSRADAVLTNVPRGTRLSTRAPGPALRMGASSKFFFGCGPGAGLVMPVAAATDRRVFGGAACRSFAISRRQQTQHPRQIRVRTSNTNGPRDRAHRRSAATCGFVVCKEVDAASWRSPTYGVVTLAACQISPQFSIASSTGIGRSLKGDGGFLQLDEPWPAPSRMRRAGSTVLNPRCEAHLCRRR